MYSPCLFVDLCRASLNTLFMVVIRHIVESSSLKSAISKYTHFPALTLAVTTGAARSSCGCAKSPNALRYGGGHDTHTHTHTHTHAIQQYKLSSDELYLSHTELYRV